MNITDRRHSDQLAQVAEVFDRQRAQNFFRADKTRRFAVISGNIKPVMKPGIFLVGNFAANFAERSGDVAFCLRRIISPARRAAKREILRA